MTKFKIGDKVRIIKYAHIQEVVDIIHYYTREQVLKNADNIFSSISFAEDYENALKTNPELTISAIDKELPFNYRVEELPSIGFTEKELTLSKIKSWRNHLK
jgi:hypothetical protein